MNKNKRMSLNGKKWSVVPFNSFPSPSVNDSMLPLSAIGKGGCLTVWTGYHSRSLCFILIAVICLFSNFEVLKLMEWIRINRPMDINRKSISLVFGNSSSKRCFLLVIWGDTIWAPYTDVRGVIWCRRVADKSVPEVVSTAFCQRFCDSHLKGLSLAWDYIIMLCSFSHNSPVDFLLCSCCFTTYGWFCFLFLFLDQGVLSKLVSRSCETFRHPPKGHHKFNEIMIGFRV